MSHKKFGPDRFSRFDVYWIQTNRQGKFIYRYTVRTRKLWNRKTTLNQHLNVIDVIKTQMQLQFFLES